MQAKQLDIFTLRRYISTIIDNSNLKVSWRRDIVQPQTIGNTIYLPEVHSLTTEGELVRLRYYVLHETLHHTENTDFQLIEKSGIKPDNPLGAIFHMLEDHRIERAGSLQYLGDADTMDKAYIDVAKMLLNAVKKNVTDPNGGPAKLAAVVYFDISCRADWLPSMQLVEPEFAQVMLDTGANIQVSKISNKGFVERLANPENSTQDILDLSKDIYDALFDDEDDQSAEDQMSLMADAKADAKVGADPTDEDDDSSEAKPDEAGLKDGEEKGVAREVKYDWATREKERKKKGAPTGVKINYDDWEFDPNNYGSYKAQQFDEMEIHNLVTGKSTTGRPSEYPKHCRVTETSKGFSNKVRRLLEIQSKSKTVHAKKKGKLDKKNLHRVGVTHKEASGYSERVFKQKENKDTLNTAVLVLCDVSGSMYGDKIQHAINSVVLLNDSLSNSLRIPLEIQTFTFDCGNMIHKVKTFENRISPEKLLINLGEATANMRGNSDGEALLYAYSCLKQRKEKRKILIVLSDGQPCNGGYGGDIAAYTKGVISEIEKDKEVSIAGIGILDASVNRFYSNCEVINRPDELEEALLKTISKRIL